MVCEFCGSAEFLSYRVREMMHGFRDKFEYLECTSCGCLRIAAVPQDLAKYYPQDAYYSYSYTYSSRRSLRTLVRNLYLRLGVGNSLIGSWVRRSRPSLTLEWANLFGLKRNMKILDVGSGGGLFLRDLRSAGFSRSLGVDPFISADLHDQAGVVVKKAQLSDIGGEWDRIMFHHSLEHIADQVGTLELARKKLHRTGMCVVRIPIAAWAWRNYGVNWVQLDPPRHLCIHTERSFRMAASKAGFKVRKVIYDSGAFQFWGSELYKQGIPLKAGEKELAQHFSSDQLRGFGDRAEELNNQGLGDQALFCLEPIN
jgi:hypothetical protein